MASEADWVDLPLLPLERCRELKKALASVMEKVRALTRREKHRTLAALLLRLNPVLRGWCTYFRHGVSFRTFGYLDHFAFWRVVGWLRKRHPKLNWGTLHRRRGGARAAGLGTLRISGRIDRCAGLFVSRHRQPPSRAWITGLQRIRV